MKAQGAKDSLSAVIWIFYLIALGCIVFGIVTAYYYPDQQKDLLGNPTGSIFNHVVGGDAYNYIIMGLRGLVWIVIGFISAIIGSTCAIIRGVHKSDTKPKKEITIQDTTPIEQEKAAEQ
ncbi:hypothetical protein [Sporolactobacillus putidus]|uniref:Uncharacterized protein n=1 Tax=Sporolactobacillus putidus TaxID=492735 RepID=A0A917S3S9_9BACL|nr:hypothetical protein [Sporolactobacillus putidus]GGL55648.1 hypothetical protein GCM10007968_19730 [Sporolactobacillus putidus]